MATGSVLKKMAVLLVTEASQWCGYVGDNGCKTIIKNLFTTFVMAFSYYYLGNLLIIPAGRQQVCAKNMEASIYFRAQEQ